MNLLQKAGRAFTIMGAAMILLAIYLFLTTLFFVVTSQSRIGSVIGHHDELSTDSRNLQIRHSYFPIVQWTDKVGVEHSFQSSMGSNPPPYEIGARVKILFSLLDPNKAKIDDFNALWLDSILSSLFGLGLLLLERLLSGFWFFFRNNKTL